MLLTTLRQHRSPLFWLCAIGFLLLLWQNGRSWLEQQGFVSVPIMVHGLLAITAILALMSLSYLLLIQFTGAVPYRRITVSTLLALPYWSQLPLHSISDLVVVFFILLAFYLSLLQNRKASVGSRFGIWICLLLALLLRPYAVFFLLLLPNLLQGPGKPNPATSLPRWLQRLFKVFLFLTIAWLYIWWFERGLDIRSNWQEISSQWPWQYWPHAIETVRHKLHALRHEYLNHYSKGYVYAVYLLSVFATMLARLLQGLMPVYALLCLIACRQFFKTAAPGPLRIWWRFLMLSLLVLYASAFVPLQIDYPQALLAALLLFLPLPLLLWRWRQRIDQSIRHRNHWQPGILYRFTWLLLLASGVYSWLF